MWIILDSLVGGRPPSHVEGVTTTWRVFFCQLRVGRIFLIVLRPVILRFLAPDRRGSVPWLGLRAVELPLEGRQMNTESAPWTRSESSSGFAVVLRECPECRLQGAAAHQRADRPPSGRNPPRPANRRRGSTSTTRLSTAAVGRSRWRSRWRRAVVTRFVRGRGAGPVEIASPNDGRNGSYGLRLRRGARFPLEGGPFIRATSSSTSTPSALQLIGAEGRRPPSRQAPRSPTPSRACASRAVACRPA